MDKPFLESKFIIHTGLHPRSYLPTERLSALSACEHLPTAHMHLYSLRHTAPHLPVFQQRIPRECMPY